jgi:hypothetical protein
MNEVTLKSEFSRLDSLRTTLISRCEQYAAWTIQSKFPPKDITDNYEMTVDFQSVGAKGTNNLVNKVMLALFAPSRPFFRPELSTATLAKMADNGIQGAAIDAILAQIAKQGMKDLESMQARAVITEAVIQLIITGNAALRLIDDEFILYTLRDYVVVRSRSGALRSAIFRETSKLKFFSDVLQATYRKHKLNATGEEEVSLYTQFAWDSKRKVWVQTQALEIYDVTVGDTQYKDADLPMRVLTWSLAPKRNYGTGLVEENQGAFHALSTLSSAEIAGLLEMCRIIHLADPSGTTDALEFQNALSGDVLNGRAEDITTPDLGGKARDYMAVSVKLKELAQFLSEVFLLATGSVRNAERVTAEEIRLIANELETSKGGVYSRLSFDLQQWLAGIAIKRNKDPNVTKLDVYVITGLDALSANGDLDNIRSLLADLSRAGELPDEVKVTIEWDSFVQLLSSLHNVDYFKFLKSQAKVKEEQAAAQANEMAMQQEQAATQAVGQVAVNNLSP